MKPDARSAVAVRTMYISARTEPRVIARVLGRSALVNYFITRFDSAEESGVIQRFSIAVSTAVSPVRVS